jgi:hypothetical protein
MHLPQFWGNLTVEQVPRLVLEDGACNKHNLARRLGLAPRSPPNFPGARLRDTPTFGPELTLQA